MAEVARRIEAPLGPEQYHDYTISSRVDEDLSKRIRSLLTVQNGHHIPKAPCPSPDFAYLGHNSVDRRSSYSSINPSYGDLSVAKTIAKLTLIESREPVVVASRYDGPAGQMDGLNNDPHHREPSEPNADQELGVGREESEIAKALSGLNQFTSGDQHDRAHRRSDSSATPSMIGIPSRPMSISSKRSTASRAPALSLRTVAPHNSRHAEVPFKPKLYNVPGSFQTDTEVSTTRAFVTPASSFGDRPTTAYQVAELPQPVPESKPKPHSRAVEALTNVRGHDSLDSALHPKAPLRKEPSISTLGSAFTSQSHHPPSKIFVGWSNVSEAAEPVVTSETGQGRSYSKVLETLPRPLGTQRKKDQKIQQGSLSASDKSIEMENAASNSVLSRSPSSSSHPELSADLPPVTEQNLRKLEDRYQTEEFAVESGLPLSMSHALTRKATAIYSPNVGGSLSVHLSASFSEGDGFGQSQKSTLPTLDNENVLGRDTDSPSLTTRKLSSLSNAISASISSIRAGLQIPILGTSSQHEKNSDMDPVGRMQKPKSLPFLKGGQRSLDNPEDVIPLKQSKTIGHSEQQPKMQWIRALVTPRSTASLSQSQGNLTERPSRRKSSAANTTKSRSLENSPEDTERSELNDSKSSLKHVSGEGIDEKRVEVRQQKSALSLKGVVQDLEGLLKEALLIARHAADSSGEKDGPLSQRLPLSTHSSLDSVYSNDGVSSSGSLYEEDRYTTFPSYRSNHGKSHVDAAISDDDLTPVAHFVKNPNAAVYPGRSVAPTRLQSTAAELKTVDISHDEEKGQESSLKSQDQNLPDPIIVPSHPGSEVAKPILNALDDSFSTVPFCHTRDWAYVKLPSQTEELGPLNNPAFMPRQPEPLQTPLKEDYETVLRNNKPCPTNLPGSMSHINSTVRERPMIQPRTSSAGLRSTKVFNSRPVVPKLQSSNEEYEGNIHMAVLQPNGTQYRSDTQHTLASRPSREPSFSPEIRKSDEDEVSSLRRPGIDSKDSGLQHQDSTGKRYSLKNRRHFSFREGNGISLSRSHRRAPIARDWSTSRKRYVATVTCISTALLGLIIGIYAGEVPAIQYTIVDEHHYTILGNVGFFLGLAISTGLFWPLPILHGRKPYTLAALAILLPLQFPQALSVNAARSPYVATYRVGLLLSRAISGFIMGFANVNFKTTLLDLFGASLQSSNPHQETVSSNDVRRHGGGMGVWLGIWTWCSIGSIGLGFLIGALIISGLDVAWGFWITTILTAFTLILNVLVPEVRRSAYRRSMAEVQKGRVVSRRIAKGEIKMHIDSTGPMWWGEEVAAGYKLCRRMLKQPGFFILSLYVGWIYGQIVMLIVVSNDQGGKFSIAYGETASGGVDVQVLSLSSTVCRTLRGCDSSGCLTCNTFSEGIAL